MVLELPKKNEVLSVMRSLVLLFSVRWKEEGEFYLSKKV